jgi:hypothetical protein
MSTPGPPEEPRHESLEQAFFAVVPPRRAPWRRRALWWALVRLLQFRLLRALLLRSR